jgi:dTDP-4-amino-4,6-dideoxygalactose transaminase
MDPKPTYVTRPFLPPLEEFLPYLEQIWESRWLTNSGVFHERLESALAEYLGVKHLALFTNGTIALVTALQALRVTGEVITTPYSFVATAHSLVWNNIRPVFVDVDPETCNLDPKRIEAAITPQTTALLPVHCYGTPCDVEAMQALADVYGLKIIYDAAHAFRVDKGSQSVLQYGDLSVLSFHATKVFHTFEGGAIVCPDAKTKKRINYLKNFGFADEVTIVASGINGKMSEIQAAMGLAQLDHMDRLIEQRGRIDATYRRSLAGIPGIELLAEPVGFTPNHSYFPIFVGPEYGVTRDGLYERLRAEDVLARRYFYPLISDMPMYRGLASAAPANLPQATRLAQRVLCLPIYPDLPDEDLQRTIDLIKG